MLPGDAAIEERILLNFSSPLLEGESGHCGAPPSRIYLILHRPCWSGKAAIAERPPLASSAIFHSLCLSGKGAIVERPPLALPCISCFSPIPCMGRPAARNPQAIQIQSDLSISLVPRRSPWKIQSDLLYASLLKSARASPVRSPLAFSRRPLDPLLSEFLPLFLILDAVHCASNPSGFSLLVVVYWLGF